MTNLKPLKKIFFISLFIIVSTHSVKSVATPLAPINTEASINLIHQHTSDSQITPETTFSMDLNLEYKFLETDLISFHLEASSTPQKNGVSTAILDSNADSSSAVDRSNNGRIQVSELFYQAIRSNNQRFTIGLLDATSFLDSSLTANDENQQFITPSLVNNPVIDFPDYVIGLAY